jgi:hypothetical protein
MVDSGFQKQMHSMGGGYGKFFGKLVVGSARLAATISDTILYVAKISGRNWHVRTQENH